MKELSLYDTGLLYRNIVVSAQIEAQQSLGTDTFAHRSHADHYHNKSPISAVTTPVRKECSTSLLTPKQGWKGRDVLCTGPRKLAEERG